jgi:hypothetical protein
VPVAVLAVQPDPGLQGRLSAASKTRRVRAREPRRDMRKAMVLVAMAATAVAVGGLVNASAAPSDSRAEVITGRLVVGNGYNVDNGQPGPSGGDLFGSSGVLRRDGSDVGRFSSACQLSPPVGAQCQGTLSFQGEGGVQIAGNVVFENPHNRTAIVGGTGRFSDAGGYVELDTLDGPDPGTVQRLRLTILR